MSTLFKKYINKARTSYSEAHRLPDPSWKTDPYSEREKNAHLRKRAQDELDIDEYEMEKLRQSQARLRDPNVINRLKQNQNTENISDKKFILHQNDKQLENIIINTDLFKVFIQQLQKTFPINQHIENNDIKKLLSVLKNVTNIKLDYQNILNDTSLVTLNNLTFSQMIKHIIQKVIYYKYAINTTNQELIPQNASYKEIHRMYSNDIDNQIINNIGKLLFLCFVYNSVSKSKSGILGVLYNTVTTILNRAETDTTIQQTINEINTKYKTELKEFKNALNMVFQSNTTYTEEEIQKFISFLSYTLGAQHNLMMNIYVYFMHVITKTH